METNNQNSELALRVSPQLALSDSPQSKDRLDELLAGCFSLQKMYGRSPESMETVTNLFHGLLKKHQADKVIRAFEIWLERSQEFPTPSDIVSLIRRNGRPPLSKERFIAISKKDYENRSYEENLYMREYEDEQDEQLMSGGDDDPKISALIRDNESLRKRIRDLEAETHRAWDCVKEERKLRAENEPLPTVTQMVINTIKGMKETGAKLEDIEEFASAYGLSANEVLVAA